MRVLRRLCAIAAMGLASCGGTPAELTRFAKSPAERLPVRVLAPGADTICVMTPYQRTLSGAGADEFNRYVADQGLELTDDGQWMLLWRRGVRIFHRRVERFPVDLVNDGGWVVMTTVPKDLRMVNCAAGADAVLVKLSRSDRVNVVLAEPIGR